MKHDPTHPLAAYGLPTLALSIRQPWAYCIMHEGKDIENRTWPTNYRGPVLIHAAKGFGPAGKADVRDLDAYCDIKISYPSLLFGHILGVARISGCVTESESEWFNGPFGFTLFGVQRLPVAIPCKGALGMFRPVVDEWILKDRLGDWKLPELDCEY